MTSVHPDTPPNRWLAAAGVALWAAFALPVSVPPPAVDPASPAADAVLLTGLFPGIPPLWLAGRPIALALGAAALAAAAPSLSPPRPQPRAPVPTRAILLAGISVAWAARVGPGRGNHRVWEPALRPRRVTRIECTWP